MAAPTQERNVQIDYSTGVSVRDAQHLIIHVDDQEINIGTLLAKNSAAVNNKADPKDHLQNLSHQFFLSMRMPIDQVVDSIFTLISRTPTTCRVGIVLDHDQNGYTGIMIAAKVREEQVRLQETRNIRIIGFSGRAEHDDVIDAWKEGGETLLSKLSFDSDFNAYGAHILATLFPNQD